MTGAVVVSAVRTPFARLDGGLREHDAQRLAAHVIRAAVERAGVDAAAVDDVLVATATGPGGNLARRAALDAGMPPSVPGVTLDRQCGGGMDAVALACRLVQAGAGRIYVAAGVESASTSPLRQLTDGGSRFFPRMPFSAGGWDDPGMAESAQLVADEHGISRQRQDEYALRSHRRAVEALSAGAFGDEIAALGGVATDECPRATLTPERMARFSGVIRAGGSVTAANSSQVADGAAAVVVTDTATARGLGITHGLCFVDHVTAGVDPRVCGLGAIDAVRALEARDAGWHAADATTVAMTEAFASQVVATVDALGLDVARLNPRGGAIALGHPWGASGAAQVVRIFHELRPREGGDALALAAVAGGMGVASRWRWGAT